MRQPNYKQSGKPATEAIISKLLNSPPKYEIRKFIPDYAACCFGKFTLWISASTMPSEAVSKQASESEQAGYYRSAAITSVQNKTTEASGTFIMRVRALTKSCSWPLISILSP